MKAGISIVICTYNGAMLLPETIAHIARQQLSYHVNWEIIVVDNASTDNTAEVVLEEWKKHGSPTELSLLYQPRQGLTFAREMALNNSKYEYVLFCDDDNWLCPNYLELAYELMETHPEIGVLGGNGELTFGAPPPLWAVGHGFFANGPQAKVSGAVKRQFVYGAGCVIRKSAYDILLKAGFKPLLTDRMAGKLTAGGDYELCYAIALAGYEIWYEEKLRFQHFMPKSRLDWDYFVRFISEGAKCFEVVVPYRIRVNMGSKSSLSFRIMFLRILISYLVKSLPLLVGKLSSYPGTDKDKLHTIKLISLKTKLQSLKNYKHMEKNFNTILKFELEELKHAKKRRAINKTHDLHTLP